MILPTASLPPASATARPGVAAPAAARHGGTPGVVIVTSEQLFGGAQEVQIEHHGALYRLKRTSLGKLILTK